MATASVLSPADAEQLTSLRAELKQWEKAFAAANGGRKAGRDDIKQDPAIAAKYKAYGRLRALEASSSESRQSHADRTPSKSESQQTKAKRKHSSLAGAEGQSNGFTPRKASRRELLTPSRGRTTNVHPADLDPYDSPSTLRRLFSPSTHRQSQSPLPLKTAIGPTPQRDGKVLGLFDLLSASGGSTATPSAKRVATLEKEAIQTPSKKVKLDTIEEGDEEEEETGRLGRTPASSSKKLYLEKLFATPTTLRYATMVEDEESGLHRHNASQTAANDAPEANPLESETPSFLRRSNSGRFTSNPNPSATDLSPVAVRKPQRFVGKGLSALVQGLRDMEEERMREDWEILREIEEEQAQAAQAKDVQVGDSQVPANDGDARRPLRKKRGQKRTTRLVKMKPVPPKPKPAPQASTAAPEAEDESEDELAVVIPVRQGSAEKEAKDQDENADDAASNQASDVDADADVDVEDDSDADYDGKNEDEDEDEDESRTTKRPKSSFSEKIKAAFSVVKRAKPGDDDDNKKKNKDKADGDGDNETKAKKSTTRKINPQAHANYRALKLRNKGAKGQRGRFGRRR